LPVLPILLADPDPQFTRTLQYALEAAHPHLSFHHVHTAGAAKIALESLAEAGTPAVLCVVTFELPDEKGDQVLRHSKQYAPSAIALLTSHRQGRDMRGAILNGHLSGNLFDFVEKERLMKRLPEFLEIALDRQEGRDIVPALLRSREEVRRLLGLE
jgi:DNA-binding NarL/FixJ family response regulator